MPSAARSGSRWVVVDANGWLLPFRTGTRLADEVDRLVPGAALAVPSSVLEELDALASEGVPHAAAARALAGRARRVPVASTRDTGVVEAAQRLRAPVVTADRALAERLRAAGRPVLVPRAPSRLMLRPAAPAGAPRRAKSARVR